jgi:hypothetical protein
MRASLFFIVYKNSSSETEESRRKRPFGPGNRHNTDEFFPDIERELPDIERELAFEKAGVSG